MSTYLLGLSESGSARLAPRELGVVEPVVPQMVNAARRSGSVTGRVTDANNGAPIRYVQVYVAGLSLGSLTRATGEYEIRDVPPGTYEVRAERIGLTLGRREVTVVEGGAVAADFELASQAIGMDEILSDRLPGAQSVREALDPPSEAARAQAARIPDSVPRFTPHTVRPSLLNGPEVQAAMTREYPPVLRDAGIGGTVMVWLFIDANGVVENARVRTASGYPPLDAAALEVGRAMRFSPAYNRDQPVAVWVAIPITFRRG
jgi:TonB family protein